MFTLDREFLVDALKAMGVTFACGLVAGWCVHGLYLEHREKKKREHEHRDEEEAGTRRP